MADEISNRVSTSDVKRIQSDVLAAEVKHLRRMLKRNKGNAALQEASNVILAYMEQRSLVLRLEAQQLELL